MYLPRLIAVLFSISIVLCSCTSAIKKGGVRYSKSGEEKKDNKNAGLAMATGDAVDKVDSAVRDVESLQDDKRRAEEHYLLAQRHLSRHDYKMAEQECLNALRFDPNHAGATALLYEIRSILKKGPDSIDSFTATKLLEEVRAKTEQRILEVQRAFQTGLNHYNAGEYDKAERAFKTLIEISRWIYPKSPAIESLVDQAKSMLRQTESARRQKEIDDARIREKIMKEEELRLAEVKTLEEKKRIELLFNQAKLHFEREEYDDCIFTCEKILFMNPNLSDVRDLKSISQRLKYMKAEESNTLRYVREYKETIRRIEADTVLPQRKLQFPDRSAWAKIEARFKKRIEGEEYSVPEEDRSVMEQIEIIHISMPDFTTLKEFIERLREAVETVQFFVDKSVENQDMELKSPKIQAHLPVKKIMEIVFQPTDLTFYVTKGSVLILTKEAYARKTSVLRLYEVNELLFTPPDFPAPTLNLGDTTETPLSDEERVIAWDPNKIIELITKSFGGEDAWGDDKPMSIKFLETAGVFVIKAPPEIQKGVGDFISKLRENTGINVSVESRFLMIDDTFLENIGIDFRDLDPTQLQDETRRVSDNVFINAGLDDVLIAEPTFGGVGSGLDTTPRSGILASYGTDKDRHVGAVVQNLMMSDDFVKRFTNRFVDTAGGGMLQYVLMDALTVEGIVKLVHKTKRGFELTTKSVTLLNTTLGHMTFTNTAAYVKDWNAMGGSSLILPDPVPSMIKDGLSLEVRPIVSADRKYVTLQVKPTVASLVPKLPGIFGLPVIMSQGTSGWVVTIELPILQIQKLATTVIVPDGGTLLIGGLTVYDDVNEKTSVPIWDAIPILNTLGSAKFKGKSRQQLLILLRADIIIPSEEEKKQVG